MGSIFAAARLADMASKPVDERHARHLAEIRRRERSRRSG